MFLVIYDLSDAYQDYFEKRYKLKHNSRHIYIRMITMMKTVLNEGLVRAKTLNHLRFMYEETPFYEMGYLMGEIIERYRKMVNHARRRFTFRSAYIHDLVRRVQVTQFLYFELYNLCRMLHEIELKYKTDIQFQDIHTEVDMVELARYHENLRLEAIFVEKERQRKIKKEKKLFRKIKRLHNNFTMYQKPDKQKGFWPIEYGWDIGAYW